jgi:hypothetical protein
MHPLLDDLSSLKDAEIEAKISDLSKKYFSTGSMELRSQIAMILDSFREELAKRQADAYNKMMQTRNKDLDKLINVN